MIIARARLGARCFVLSMVLLGCTSAAEVRDDVLQGRTTGAAIEGVPFVQQRPDTCGAAALASVLGHQGQAASADEMAEALRIAQRQGALTYELALEARRHGALAAQRYEVMPETLMRAVDAGVAPIILRGNLLHEALGRYHYSVLTAYDRDRRVWIAHDGEEADVIFSFEKVAEDHARADSWVLFVTMPEQRPQGLPADIHLEWGLQAEGRGDVEAARHHYAQAAWRPGAQQALLNLSNVAAAAGDQRQALTLLRQAHHLDPSSASIKNNLAWALLQLGEDLELAARLASEAAEDEEIRPYALDTLQRIEEAMAAGSLTAEEPLEQGVTASP